MGKVRNVVISSLATVGLVAGVLVGGQVMDRKQADSIVEDNIAKMEIDDSYYLENNALAFAQYDIRQVDTSRPVIMYLDSSDFSELEFNVIQDVLNNLNEVFERMHSDIRVQATYGEEVPNFQIFDANSIVCRKSFTIDSSVAAYAYINRDLLEMKYNYDSFHKYSYGAKAFLHETMHFFGLGDSYMVEGNQTPSIMHALGSDYQTPFLSVNDMKMLASMYGHFETEQDWQEFVYFAEQKEKAVLEEYDKVAWAVDTPLKPRMNYTVARRILNNYVDESYFTEHYSDEMAEMTEWEERLMLGDLMPESYFEERFGGKEK